MKYRAEIDGLRAIAVIPVVLFHAGFAYCKGGFVGVDVFFVISGYLITTIILSEKEHGTFSLVRFYERRARRILPALFLVMLVTLPFAWLWLLPADMKDFSQSLVAVSSYVSNILFWRQSGYWGAANEVKPLLHTWSLAVEEQYYILFPSFLMVMWRFRKRWIFGSFVLIAAVSLLFAQWAVYYEPDATFFLLPTRGWELAIGASISFFSLYQQRTVHTLLSNRFINEALSFVGLLMIAYSVFSFDEHVPFPSFYALVPTMGTGLIIFFSSPQTLVGQLLGTKLLVGIGLISYSAYLWHQPLFAFARQISLTRPSNTLLSILIVVSFLLAYLSWRFAEQPFRNKEVVSRKAIFSYALIGSIFFIMVGIIGNITDGFNNRTGKRGEKLQFIEEKLEVDYGLSITCDDLSSPTCRTSNEPEIVVWGDSFARHLVQGIMASNPNAKVIQMTKSLCGPFFDIAPVTPNYPVRWAKDCLEFNGKVREWLQTNNTVKYAVLSSPFSQYLSEKNSVLFRSNDIVAANLDLATEEMERTLNELADMGITPIIFSPPPANGVDLGRCLGQAEWRGLHLGECNFPVMEMTQARLDSYRFLEQLQGKFRVIRLDRLICDSSICVTHIGSTFMFRDTGHLSRGGSAELGKRSNFYKLIVADAVASPQD